VKKVRQIVNFFNETQIGILAFTFSTAISANLLVFASNRISDSFYEKEQTVEEIKPLISVPIVVKVLFSPNKHKVISNSQNVLQNNKSTLLTPDQIQRDYKRIRIGSESDIRNIAHNKYIIEQCHSMLDYYGDSRPKINIALSFMIEQERVKNINVLVGSGYSHVDDCIVNIIKDMQIDSRIDCGGRPYETIFTM
jgi:hypothetical protein